MKEKKILVVVAAVILLIGALLAGCEKKPELSVNPVGALVFSADGSQATLDGNAFTPMFTVSTNQAAWMASSNQAWLRVSTDGNTFTLSADAYKGLIPRGPATVTIAAEGTEAIRINVSQNALSIEASEYAAPSCIIGHGYDVTTRYAYSPEVKKSVLDFTRMAVDNLIKKDSNFHFGEFRTSAGNTAADYDDALATRAGISASVGAAGIGSFQSELSTYYKQSRYTRDAYSFATVTTNIAKEAYYVENRKESAKLIPYVSASFLKDLETQTPEKIIQQYGTHVMLGGVWGARLDYHFSAKKKIEAYSQDSGMSFSAKAEATFKGITAGGGVDTAVNSSYKQRYDDSSEEIHTNAYGGKPEFAQSIHNKQEYDKWIESIDGNTVWSDYYPESLVPVYELIADSAKKEELHKAFNKYLKDKQITVASSMKTAVVSSSFSLIGATSTGGGDKDINTQDKRDTNMSLDVNLAKITKDGKLGIEASFNYYLKEVAKNHTELTMKKSHFIPIDKDFVITSNPSRWSSGYQTIRGKKHGWETLSGFVKGSSCKFMPLDKVQIRIDGSGDDHTTMGVKGKLEIEYAYLE